MRRGAKVGFIWGSALGLTLFLCSSPARPQETGRGNLTGFIFEQNGSTPVEGAVVMVKNVTTGEVVESAASDRLGIFRVAKLRAGIYALGVKSARGEYNSEDFFGVIADKTAKISVALEPYDAAAASAAAAVIKEQRAKGEAYIGKVVKYDPETREADIQVEIGLIIRENRIHVKGLTTDFYQDTRVLKSYGAKVKRVLSGYVATLRTSKPCQPGDFVYIVCKRGVPPFFLAPLGMAAIVAGATPLIAIYEKEPISEYKVKK